MTNRPEILGKSVSAMSTAELEALLQAEMDPDRDMNVDLVDAVTAELEERTPVEVDVNAAWESFLHNHLPYEPIYPDTPAETSISKQSSKPGTNRRLIRIGLIAAVLILLLIGTVSASRLELWSMIRSRSSETFQFSFGGDTPVVSNPELTTLRNQLNIDHVDLELVPRYLPPDYSETEFYADGRQYVGVYENSDNAITIQIRKITNNNGAQFEIDAGSTETYTVNGIDHLISTNMGFYKAAWINGDYECSISHVPSRDDLIQMIQSIYPNS